MGGRMQEITVRCLAALLLALLVAGCSSTKEAAPSNRVKAEEEARSFESTFDPSDYDPLHIRLSERHPRLVDTANVEAAEELTSPTSQELVQGYRVQVYSSASIDEARAKKAEFETLFPKEWFYLQYDTPTYKLRAGNFQNRMEADRFARSLIEQGYANAWAVPQRVLKSPPPRPPAPVTTPE